MSSTPSLPKSTSAASLPQTFQGSHGRLQGGRLRATQVRKALVLRRHRRQIYGACLRCPDRPRHARLCGSCARLPCLPCLCRDVLLLEPAVPFIAVLCRHPTLELARGDIRSEMKFPFPPSQGDDTAHQLEFFVHRYALDLRNSELALQSGIAVGRDIPGCRVDIRMDATARCCRQRMRTAPDRRAADPSERSSHICETGPRACSCQPRVVHEAACHDVPILHLAPFISLRPGGETHAEIRYEPRTDAHLPRERGDLFDLGLGLANGKPFNFKPHLLLGGGLLGLEHPGLLVAIFGRNDFPPNAYDLSNCTHIALHERGLVSRAPALHMVGIDTKLTQSRKSTSRPGAFGMRGKRLENEKAL